MEKPDALMDVLDMLKPRGRVYCCSEMSAPWAMSLPADGYARFHVIERGGAWLRVDGAKQLTPLVSGDLVIVPHGNGHVLADSPKTKPVPIIRLVKGKTDSPILLQHGGRGAKTLMICGSFKIVNSDYNPLLAVMPPLNHIPSARDQLDEWLEPTLRMLAYEARRQRPGSETLVARLNDIILVQAVRVWFEKQPRDRGGWLGALSNPPTRSTVVSRKATPSIHSEVATLPQPAFFSITKFLGHCFLRVF